MFFNKIYDIWYFTIPIKFFKSVSFTDIPLCRLFGFNAGKLKIDERINLCMSDPDLVPLIIQVWSKHPHTCIHIILSSVLLLKTY